MVVLMTKRRVAACFLSFFAAISSSDYVRGDMELHCKPQIRPLLNYFTIQYSFIRVRNRVRNVLLVRNVSEHYYNEKRYNEFFCSLCFSHSHSLSLSLLLCKSQYHIVIYKFTPNFTFWLILEEV